MEKDYRVLEFTEKKGKVEILATKRKDDTYWRADLTVREIASGLTEEEADVIERALHKLHKGE
jgi:hypothetical protein